MNDKETKYLLNHARLMDAIDVLKAAADDLPSPDDEYHWGHVETMGHLAASVEAILDEKARREWDMIRRESAE
jgi:hypothetical protein